MPTATAPMARPLPGPHCRNSAFAAGSNLLGQTRHQDYFASVDHEILLARLAQLADGDDYFSGSCSSGVRFHFHDEAGAHQAQVGIPFGAAIACLFANIYLTGLDHQIERIPEIVYFRYADDLLVMSLRVNLPPAQGLPGSRHGGTALTV